MLFAAASYLSFGQTPFTLAETPVTCNATKAVHNPICCESVGGSPSSNVDVVDFVRNGYGENTECPFDNITIACQEFEEKYIQVECCEQTYADVGAWVLDALPTPAECLANMEFIDNATVSRFGNLEWLKRNFLRSWVLPTDDDRRLLLTNELIYVDPTKRYQSCEDFGTWDYVPLEEGGECAWWHRHEDTYKKVFEFRITNMEDHSYKTIVLDGIMTTNCAKYGCCAAGDSQQVFDCIMMKALDVYESQYLGLKEKNFVADYGLKFHDDGYAYITSTMYAYRNFELYKQPLQPGDSTQWYPELFPWQNAESYVYKIRIQDLVNAKDGARLPVTLVYQDLNPETTGWGGNNMHLSGDTLWSSTNLATPSFRLMSLDLTTGTVQHYPEWHGQRPFMLTGVGDKLFTSSVQQGAFGNETNDNGAQFSGVNAPKMDILRTGTFRIGTSNGVLQIEPANEVLGGLTRSHTESHGEWSVVGSMSNPYTLYVPDFYYTPTPYYGEKISYYKDFFRDVYAKAGRNVGAINMAQNALSRAFASDENSQIWDAQEVATYSIDEHLMVDVIFTDGLHVSAPLSVPEACKTIDNLKRPVIDYFGGYRVTATGAAELGKQAGDYLNDAYIAAHTEDLSAWVASGLLDTYTSPTYSMTCNAIFELKKLGVAHPHVLGDVLSDNELSMIPGSVKMLMKKWTVPLTKSKSKYFDDHPEYFGVFDTSFDDVFGSDLNYWLNTVGQLYPYVFNTTIYRVGDEFLPTEPTDGTEFETFSQLLPKTGSRCSTDNYEACLQDACILQANEVEGATLEAFLRGWAFEAARGFLVNFIVENYAFLTDQQRALGGYDAASEQCTV